MKKKSFSRSQNNQKPEKSLAFVFCKGLRKSTRLISLGLGGASREKSLNYDSKKALGTTGKGERERGGVLLLEGEGRSMTKETRKSSLCTMHLGIQMEKIPVTFIFHFGLQREKKKKSPASVFSGPKKPYCSTGNRLSLNKRREENK